MPSSLDSPHASSVLNLLFEMLIRYEQSEDLTIVHQWGVEQLMGLVDATAASLFLADELTGKLTCVYVCGGKDITGVQLERKQGIAGTVFETGVAQITDAASKDKRHDSQFDTASGFTTHNMITAPIISGTVRYGIVQLLNKYPETPVHYQDKGFSDFTKADLTLAEIAARIMALGLYAIQMAHKRAQEQVLRFEISQAIEIQQLMLNPSLSIPNICAKTRPAKQLGGDFFDYLQCGEMIVFCIGDVAGKGTPAALIMSSCIALFRSFKWNGNAISSSLNAFINQLNAFLISLNSDRFVVMSLGSLSLKKRDVELIPCGHSESMVFDFNTHNLDWFDALLPPLGVHPYEQINPPYHFRLLEKQALVLFTDGIVEDAGHAASVSQADIFHMFNTLKYERSAARLLDTFFALLDQHLTSQHDDQTVFIIV